MHARADDPHRSARRAVRDEGLPRSRKEDGFLRDWVQTNMPQWSEAERKPGKRGHDSDLVCGARRPRRSPSGEGYRIIWVRSSAKIGRDAQARQQRIERGLGALAELQARLAGPKSRLRTRQAVEQAAAAALDQASAERWIAVTVTETVQETYRQEKRRPAGKDTRYRKHTTTRFELQFTVNADTVAYDAHTYGRFPPITNDQQLADAELLAAYRYQPNLEKPHHQLKSVEDAAPVLLEERRTDRSAVSAAISSRCCAAA